MSYAKPHPQYDRLAVQAKLSGRPARRLVSLLENAAQQHRLHDLSRAGEFLRKRDKADAQSLVDLAETAANVKKLLGSTKYKTFIETFNNLTPSARLILDEQIDPMSLLALLNLPLAFDQFAERTRAAAAIKDSAASARPRRRGRPPTAYSRQRLVDYLTRLASSHSPYLAENPVALEKWVVEAARACGANVPNAKWRQRVLTKKNARVSPSI
jgi:hypothetical protein